MISHFNPFEYEEANKFTDEQILDFYIEDYNYSRFVRSKRNIFLVGERGTGKTMTLLYNSLPIQQKKAKRDGQPSDLNLISVYIPCNTALTHKREYQLLDAFQAAVISEHFFVISIMYSIINTLSKIPELLENFDTKSLKRDLEFVLDIKFPKGHQIFEGLKLAFQREGVKAQKATNAKKSDAFYENTISFSTGVMPLLTQLKRIPKLENSHFNLMIDDAHNLNPFQIKALNSWIAYRDTSIFSFKVATVKVDQPTFMTMSEGEILEGHDFTLVDMEQPYQNQYSMFGKLAREIVKRRLENIETSASPEEFFPVNPRFEEDIEDCKNLAKKEAGKKFPQGTKKQITDYIYKFSRAIYFRERSAKANLPPYSGFDVLVHISTGVIRNLLEPCFWMYDKVISEKHGRGEEFFRISEIPYSIQTDVILDRSMRKWEWIRDRLDKSIEGCSPIQAKQIYQLFDNLAILFKKRLLHHKSEPRAITFTISVVDYKYYSELEQLLKIARKAQILYTYTSSAKDYGKREIYYVPNRILWPDRGLDPHGQHARVSLRASHLFLAAKDNKRIPFSDSEESLQQGLFNNE